MAKKGSLKQRTNGRHSLGRKIVITAADSALIESERFAKPGRKRHSCAPDRPLRAAKRHADANPDALPDVPVARDAGTGLSASTDAELGTAARPTRIKSFSELPDLLGPVPEQPTGIKRHILNLLQLFK